MILLETLSTISSQYLACDCLQQLAAANPEPRKDTMDFFVAWRCVSGGDRCVWLYVWRCVSGGDRCVWLASWKDMLSPLGA